MARIIAKPSVNSMYWMILVCIDILATRSSITCLHIDIKWHFAMVDIQLCWCMLGCDWWIYRQHIESMCRIPRCYGSEVFPRRASITLLLCAVCGDRIVVSLGWNWTWHWCLCSNCSSLFCSPFVVHQVKVLFNCKETRLYSLLRRTRRYGTFPNDMHCSSTCQFELNVTASFAWSFCVCGSESMWFGRRSAVHCSCNCIQQHGQK